MWIDVCLVSQVHIWKGLQPQQLHLIDYIQVLYPHLIPCSLEDDTLMGRYFKKELG